MMSLLDRSLATVMIAFAVLFVSSPARSQDKWEVADSNIKRLPPNAFTQLPRNILRYLEANRCTIPQYYADQRPHNVIHGQFARKGQYDWAVLCSRNRISSIIVFWNGSAKKRSEIVKSADRIYLQGDERGGPGFSRVIGVVGKKFILDHYRAYGGPKPPPITHQGIDDGFMEKGSVVLYYHRHKWLELQGSD